MLLFVAACGDNLPPLDPPSGTCSPVEGTNVALRRVAFGCKAEGAPVAPNCIDDTVTLTTSPPDDPRLFIVERNGKIRWMLDEHLQNEPFADLSLDAGGPVYSDGNELGLLGLAFHPQFAENGQIYVYYTAQNANPADVAHPYVDVVARYRVDSDTPDRISPGSGEIVLSIPDPFSNHNGGMIEFGADGLLYIGTGDGGNGGDPMGNGQNPHALLGKILRVDVDRGAPYSIPAGNPFADGAAGAAEVFVLGLRNPWRWSFDRATGDMWIGDVGQSEEEEIDWLPAGYQAGRNLGWNMYEGFRCYSPPCAPDGLVFPVDSRTHGEGWWAIVGGQVYRGACFPDLQGWYFFTDTGHSSLSSMRFDGDGNREVRDYLNAYTAYPTSLHADARGELYEGTLDGSVFRIEVAPAANPN